MPKNKEIKLASIKTNETLDTYGVYGAGYLERRGLILALEYPDGTYQNLNVQMKFNASAYGKVTEDISWGDERMLSHHQQYAQRVQERFSAFLEVGVQKLVGKTYSSKTALFEAIYQEV